MQRRLRRVPVRFARTSHPPSPTRAAPRALHPSLQTPHRRPLASGGPRCNKCTPFSPARQPLELRDAPLFFPTEAEFTDPMVYISKIQPEVYSYGAHAPTACLTTLPRNTPLPCEQPSS